MILSIQPEHRIRIPQAFREEFQHRRPHWGPIGEQVYMRTYSGLMEDGRRERWLDTVIRIEEGHFTLLKRQAMAVDAWWSDDKAQRLMVESGTRLWQKKWTPAGRGLQFMGTKTMEAKGGAVGMSCAFVSTKDICRNFTEPFCRMFDLLMLGVGVGFDDRGKGTMKLSFNGWSSTMVHQVEDTREGWVDALKVLLLSFVPGGMKLPTFDFSGVRKKGSKLVTMGGVASGPEPLARMLSMVESRLINSAAIDLSISEATICDVMNLIATCVVSGGVRRSSQVYLGEATDAFMDLKNPHTSAQALASHRWASNNSIFAHLGMNYRPIAERIAHNGEPGLLWLDDMVRRRGRIADPEDLSDEAASGANPCLEQQLHNNETCNLVELFMSRHSDLNDWLKTIKHAYLYGKAMTLAEIHDPKVYEIGQRNRRIGLSITGVAEMYERLGARELSRWLDTGYREVERLDQLYSGWLEIPRSIRKTSLKPSGSVSTLPGVQGGIRFPEDLFYLRLVRFADTDPMWQRYADAGYQVEDDEAAKNTKVVYFPVEEVGFRRTVKDVSLREQMSLGALVQRWWADNMVSATYMIHENELGQVSNVLEEFEGRLKCASFLPIQEKGKYAQMPYTTCSRETFDAMRSRIKPVSYHENDGAIEVQKFCDGDSCQIR